MLSFVVMVVVMVVVMPVAIFVGGAVWSAINGWLLCEDADDRAKSAPA